MRRESAEREPPARKAIRGTFAGCASAVTGAATRTRQRRATTTRVMGHLPMPGMLRREAGRGQRAGYCMGRLLYDLVRPQQHRLGDRQAQGLGGLEVDDQLELRRLLDRQVGGLRAIEDLRDLPSGLAQLLQSVYPV